MEGLALYCAYLWCSWGWNGVQGELVWEALIAVDVLWERRGAKSCRLPAGGGIQLSGVIPAIKVIPAKQNAVVCLEAAPGPGGDGVALPLLTFYW